MVCLGLKPWGAEWKTQTNQLSYGGTPKAEDIFKKNEPIPASFSVYVRLFNMSQFKLKF